MRKIVLQQEILCGIKNRLNLAVCCNLSGNIPIFLTKGSQKKDKYQMYSLAYEIVTKYENR